MSILFSFFFFLVIIFLLCLILFRDSEQIRACKIAYLSLFSYAVFTCIAYFGFVKEGMFFVYPDQGTFFSESQYLGDFNSLYQIFDACFIHPVYVENSGAYFTFGSIAYIANSYFDGNSIFLQMIHVAFLASLITVFVFRILLFFVAETSAYRGTICYAFCSYIFYFSPWLLRDIHIALLYAIGLSILFSEFKVYRLIILCVLLFLTLFFRLENGLFMVFMPLLYLYEQTKRNKILHYSFIILLLVVGVIISSVIFSQLLFLQGSFERYVEYTQNSAEESSGLGKYIFRLPSGIKQLVSVLYSQITPFPSWTMALQATNLFQFLTGCIQMIAPAFWFLVWFCVVKAMYALEEYRKGLPPILLYSGLAFLLFLFANSSNIMPRRLFCMYPVLYLFFVIAREKYPLYVRETIRQGGLVYLMLCLVYLVIKL